MPCGHSLGEPQHPSLRLPERPLEMPTRPEASRLHGVWGQTQHRAGAASPPGATPTPHLLSRVDVLDGSHFRQRPLVGDNDIGAAAVVHEGHTG